jgi:hypothetical protein
MAARNRYDAYEWFKHLSEPLRCVSPSGEKTVAASFEQADLFFKIHGDAETEPGWSVNKENGHPLVRFWKKDSGWYDEHGSAHELNDGLSEANLAIDAWNAAINAALNCVTESGNPLVAMERMEKLLWNKES